jgi:hypothetical protein
MPELTDRCAACGEPYGDHSETTSRCPGRLTSFSIDLQKTAADGIRVSRALAQQDGEALDVTLRTLTMPGYESLARVLRAAYAQAADGKGKERHAGGQPFDEQPMQTIASMVGLGFPLGQAIKKIQESQRMDRDAAVRELLGAINYIAGAVIALEGKR